MVAEPAPSTPFPTLLALQDEDVHLAQLRHRRDHLPQAAELAAVEGRIARLDSELASLGQRRDDLAARRDLLEHEAEGVQSRIARIEQQLASGGAASYRDQEAMALEESSLAARKRSLEDDELEVMEEIEPLDAEAARLQSERQREMGAALESRSRLDEAAAAIDAEIAEAMERRARLSGELPEALRAEYERLAARLDGVAVARLVGGRCAGCHLTLPATELDAIRRAAPGVVFHCDQCGRILVPIREAAGTAAD